MEIFFGAPWPRERRLSLPAFLRRQGFSFYLYAPKADANLRRRWREAWAPEYQQSLRELAEACHAHEIQFAVGLSPMGFQSADASLLEEKARQLDAIGVQALGLFFDDMPVTPDLAANQLRALEIAGGASRAKLLFCPSFYSFDPILPKVFGVQPPGYLETLGAGAAPEVDILWTGPKVISPEIPAEHLREVARLLRRPPFLCDNFYANDGPKHCLTLPLKHPTGRPPAAIAESRGWALNPMNQFHLSEVALCAFRMMAEGQEPEAAWEGAVQALCSPGLATLLGEYRTAFYEKGLGELAKDETLHAKLAPLAEPVAEDIRDWLAGTYTVGSECLTD